MSRMFAIAATLVAMSVGAVSAQNNYMKAAPSSDSAAKSAPVKSTKKAPTISTKCQSPGTNKAASC